MAAATAWLQQGSQQDGGGGKAGTQPVLSSSHVVSFSSTAPAPGTGPFAAGEVVEYFSSSQGKWIPAKVLEAHANGTYSLDCKPDVPADRIRRAVGGGRAAGAPDGDDYRVGEVVEYFGATQGKWIPAKVTKVNADGTWDLDCKPRVTRDKIRRPAAATDLLYKEGDAVEYFGASQNRWIPAKVTKVNADGTWDLDCKPNVTRDKIRRPVDATPMYKEGDAVEYFGASQNRWIPAKVLKVNPNGTFDLDCKPSVASDKIRPADTGPAKAGEKFSAGDVVEYFSSSLGKWIPAKVLGVNPNGSYQLDCKPDVPPDKVRLPQAPAGSGPVGSSASVGPLGSSVSMTGAEPPFSVGDVVEYYGATKGKWIRARVTKTNPNGTYDLDCKPGVQRDKIRQAPSDREFQVGEVVDYFGASQQKWIKAKVLQVNADGETYNLDCKPNVPPSRMRKVDADSGTEGNVPSNTDGVPIGSSPYLAADQLRTRAAAGCDRPLQLVRAEKAGSGWRYEVCAEGAAALEQHGSRRIAVAVFCGAQSSGKGSLLNSLLPSARGRAPSATQGLWLWGALEGDEEEQGPLLAFLDCEGFGARGPECSAQLATLSALLASVMVLSSSGELTEEVFETLAPLCKLEVNIDERGSEGSRPALLWVLRDCPPTVQESLADDYLERALHSAAPSTARAGPDLARAQTARDARIGVLKYFRQRNCAALSAPEQHVAIERLRSQLSAACASSPKAIGGRPLGCFSFVALLRQLVAATNDRRILNARGAWETVQHTACGGLADDLRAEASASLHRLVAGQPVPGGARLPLTDDALHTVLRDQRRSLKSQWEERAIGDEAVRREYWVELKGTLGREEALVRAQNARAADQSLMDALRAWEQWLDRDDDQGTQPPDEICAQFGLLMERMPAGPLSRSCQQAIQAAARRVAASRGAMEVAAQRRTSLERQAVAYGERAAHQEGAARSQLEAIRAELVAARTAADEAERTSAVAQRDREARQDELAATTSDLQETVATIEAARTREHALKARHRELTESTSALRSELEQLQSTSAKSGAEKLASERCARTAEEVASIGRSRLEEQLVKAKDEAQKYQRLLEEERSASRHESERAIEEHRRRVEEVRSQLEEERRLLTGEKERTRAEHMRMVEEARRQLDEERIAYTGSLDSQKGRLLERERDTGILEGKSQALSSETKSLRERLQALEEQVSKARLQLGQQSRDNEQAKTDFDTAQADAEGARAEADVRLKAEAEKYARELADMREEVERKPKCGCSVM